MKGIAMLVQRWSQVTDRDTMMMIEEGLRTENAVQFCQIEGRWYSKISVTVQGVRVANFYFEVMDNEHVNMLNSVTQQSRSKWQAAAQEQLTAASQAVSNIDQSGGM
jgi:hypothetical protein